MTSEFENQLDAAIEKAAKEYADKFTETRNELWWMRQTDFLKGANLLKPLLMKAIEQRDESTRAIFDGDHGQDDAIAGDNIQLMKMIGDL